MAYHQKLPARDERFFQPLPQSADVLIVGAGPVGLFAAYLLALQSVSSVIIERHAHRLGQPKAHAINARSLEAFRQAGIDTDSLRSKGVPRSEGDTVRFMTVLTGEEIATLPYERQDEAVRNLTPEPLFNIAQPQLEKVLQEEALKTGLVTIHRRQDWIEYEEDTETGMITSIIKDRDENCTNKISTKFVLGADGTNSSVRKKIPNTTLESIDPQSKPRRYVSIHFTADLRPYTLSDMAQLYFFIDPETDHASLIGYGNPSWVYARPLKPGGESIDSFSPETCHKLINTAIGRENPHTQIHAVQIWETHPAVCTLYADESCRVLLAGDSAHQFPPQGGLGVNTGIADAHNIVWKIGYAIREGCQISKRFLNTYTEERRPVALSNAKQSAINELHMRQLDTECVDLIRKDNADHKTGIASGIFKEPQVHGRVMEAIERNRDHFNSLGLQLGYIYGRPDAQDAMNDCSTYQASFQIGARLPHSWLSSDNSESVHSHREISTLDLVSYSGYTLFTLDAVAQPRIKRQIGKVTIQLSFVDLRGWKHSPEWATQAGLVTSKMLLVRPDQHILGTVDTIEQALEIIARYMHI